MAYNQQLALRVSEILVEMEQQATEKKMFGGLCFMLHNKMCLGVEKERLMVRLHPEVYASVLEKEGCYPMDFTGKPMKGYVFVHEAFLRTRKELAYWVQLAVAYNAIAKPAAKKKK